MDGILARLEHYGILDNTYIFYSTDNGYHIGQHRLQPGKECGYEEDINIPLIVRGPEVPKGVTTDVVTSHTDLASTFLQLVGQKPRPDSDGVAIPLTEVEISRAKSNRHEHINVEYWGFGLGEGKHTGIVLRKKCSSNPQQNSRSRARTLFSHDCKFRANRLHPFTSFSCSITRFPWESD